MNILVLRPTLRYLHYALVSPEGPATLCQGRVPNYRASDNGLAALLDVGRWCAASVGADPDTNAGTGLDAADAGAVPDAGVAPDTATPADALDAVALCAPYGGERFAGAVLATAAVLEELRGLEDEAPIHVPLTLAVAEASRRAFPNSPLLLLFGTAFFTALPPREHSYAVDPTLMGGRAPRRFGFHGLFHDAACRYLRDRLRAEGADRGPLRIVSVCLEPQPEVAAVQGRWPVMVTSGATPLDGLPGDTVCGDLDPQIPILLAQRLGWGEEEINRVLTRESGLAGLAAPGVTLLAVFHGNEPLPGHDNEPLPSSYDDRPLPGQDNEPLPSQADEPSLGLARDVMRHRLLQACGAAIAALGGADGLVFSGRYLGAAAALGPWLSERLGPRETGPRTLLRWERFPEPLEHVAAQAAALALRVREAAPVPA